MKSFSIAVALPLLLACGASRHEAEALGADEPSTAVRRAPAPLRRAEIAKAADDGLGALLAHVEVKPVQREGAFVGFAVLRFVCEPAGSCDADAALARIGLEPGDVLVAAFGKPIGTPDQAQIAFEALRSAPSVELTVERRGARRTVTTPIQP